MNRSGLHRLTMISAGLLLAGSAMADSSDTDARIAALEAQLVQMQAALATLRADAQASQTPVAGTLESETIDPQWVRREELEAARTMPRGTRLRYGGYVQLDAIASRYGEGSPPAVMDDLFIPALIPVAGTDGSGNSTSRTNLHAKTSRFYFGSATETDVGRISSHVELDFLLGAQGNERVSNSFAARIRHAFATWEYAPGKSIMAGQNWSTFYNVASLPDLLDFVGPAGTAFGRQPQVRWTQGGLQLAVENAITRIRLNDDSIRVDDNELMPDLVARYNGRQGDLDWSLAGVVRQLAYDARPATGALAQEDTVYGYGLSLSGVWQLGDDDLRFMFSHGNAMGRYLGLNAFDDGYVGSNDNGNIETFNQWGAYFAYRHAWTSTWRSTLSVSAMAADNPAAGDFLPADALARSYHSIHANLLYTAAPGLLFGGELMYAGRELQDGRDGDMMRLQMALKYVF